VLLITVGGVGGDGGDFSQTATEPLAVAVTPYGWLMTHCGWLAG